MLAMLVRVVDVVRPTSKRVKDIRLSREEHQRQTTCMEEYHAWRCKI